MIILQLIFLLLVPVLLFQLEKFKAFFKPIVMSYVLGVLIGNLIPGLFDKELVHELTGISIVLAIPLMLFSTNFKKLVEQPKTLLTSYFLAIIATTISVGVGYWMFKDSLQNIEVISGMLEGVYTGGTVNLNAIAIAFQAPEELTVLMNGFDWSFSGVYLLLIFTILPNLLGYILPKTKKSNIQIDSLKDDVFGALDTKSKIKSVLKGLGLSVLLLGVLAGLSLVLTNKMDEMILIFGVTAIALVLSSFKSIRNIKSNMVTADYCMIIFGFTLGLQANVYELFADKSELLTYFTVTYLAMFLIHLALARLFRVDVHSFLISSSAAVFGPPFIGPIAESLGNRNLITPGIIIALLGNAVGTYLGILVVKLLLM